MPEAKITEVTIDGEEEPIMLDMQSNEDQLNTVSIPLQNTKPVSIAIPIPIPISGGFAKDLSEDYSEEFSNNTLAVMMTERKDRQATQVVTDHFKSSPDFPIDSAA